MADTADSSNISGRHVQGIVIFLVALVGCCIFFSATVIAINMSRRRRHRFWSNLCQKYPRIMGWLGIEPVEEKPAELPTLSNSDLDTACPQTKYPAPTGEETESCSICMSSLEANQLVRTLACGHVYHSGCIKLWLTCYHARCPLCNMVIMLDNEPTVENEIRADGDIEPPTQAAQRAAF